MEKDGFVVVPRNEERPEQTDEAEDSLQFLPAIERTIQSIEEMLWELNEFIHEHPELGFEERKAHDALTRFMRVQKGWVNTHAAYGMATAWRSDFDTGRPGPVVSFNAEMGLGHACGHNLIAISAVAAGIATAETLREHNLGGRVVIFGTPAEEGGGGGKIKLLDAGAYKDVDISIISHPGIFNNSPMVRTTAYSRLEVSYHGRAAHAAKNPWAGINALDALVIAYNGISVLRQQMKPDDVVGLQITDGGNAPNVIHKHAAGVAVLRAASAGRLGDLQSKVEACFRAGAEATGATVDIKVIPGYQDHVPNSVLAASCAKYWQAVSDLHPPLPPSGEFTWVKASTDQGNVSHHLPSLNVSFAIPCDAPPHSPEFEKGSGRREAFERALAVTKAMAGAAVDVCATPGMLEEVKRQWDRDMATE